MMTKESLRAVVKRQRAEIDGSDAGIKREILADIDIQSSHAIVLSGIRRCGKSTLLTQVSRTLKQFYYFNFDDPTAIDFELADFERLDEAFAAELGSSDHYLFDEIQAMQKWEILVRHLLDRRKHVLLTGSNASLLSRELGTKLTGRHLSHELFPFSYPEFLEFRGLKPSATSCQEYLAQGGFPEYLRDGKASLLQGLLNDVLARDVVLRHGVRSTKTLKELAVYLLTNVGKEFSYNKLKTTFSVPSTNTLLDFVSYFEDSYLLFTITRFDYSLRKQQVNPRKIYSVDNGLSTVNSVTFSDDDGRMLENAVFQHLRRTHREIHYFRQKKECDFVVRERGQVTAAVQVCYRVTDENLAREVDGLLEALAFFGLQEGAVITFDQEDTFSKDGRTIRLVPAWKWMSTSGLQ